DITLGRDEARWRESVNIKQKNASVKNQLPKGSQVNKNNIPNILRQSSISLLHELLLEEDNIERRIGSALYYSLKNRILSDYEQQMVYDKLVSVLDQVKYLRGDIPIVVEPDGKMYRSKLKISDKLFRMFNKWGQLLKQ
ncbi:MAG: hypothetical protein IKL33_00850, partial [Alphaproteobacteria bacterium]|nr:hypothetical protein [Alphaproteobacteria bacterium]